MATDRARPAQNADEREMLAGWLEHHRGILIWKCEDLTAGQLRRRAAPPSTLSLLGLVRHMAEVERGWFRAVFLGEDVPDLYDRSADEDADFNDVDQADPAAPRARRRQHRLLLSGEGVARAAAQLLAVATDSTGCRRPTVDCILPRTRSDHPDPHDRQPL
jgi:hypothetical protein